MKWSRKRETAFTMIEVIIATVIISLVIVPVCWLMFQTERNALVSIGRTAAANRASLVSSVVMRSMPTSWFSPKTVTLESDPTVFGLTSLPTNLVKYNGETLFPATTTVTVATSAWGGYDIFCSVVWQEMQGGSWHTNALTSHRP